MVVVVMNALVWREIFSVAAVAARRLELAVEVSGPTEVVNEQVASTSAAAMLSSASEMVSQETKWVCSEKIHI